MSEVESQLLIELHFLPSLEYFCVLQTHKKIVLEKHEHFTKQTYRNRCHILTANGVGRLTVPLTEKHGKVLITEVKIDNSLRWQDNLWRTVVSAYAKAPFFEHYADELRRELFYGHHYLYEMNLRLLSMCLKWLQWETMLVESTRWEKTPSADVTDLRGVISAKKDFPGRHLYQPRPYQQVFGFEFVPNLSILDLIFCDGPHGTTLVKGSRKEK